MALINPVIKCISLFREVRPELHRSSRSAVANFAIDPFVMPSFVTKRFVGQRKRERERELIFLQILL